MIWLVRFKLPENTWENCTKKKDVEKSRRKIENKKLNYNKYETVQFVWNVDVGKWKCS